MPDIPRQTNVSEIKADFSFLIDLGYRLEHSEKSLRYHRQASWGMHEVVVRASTLHAFRCEFSVVKRRGPNRVKSKAITANVANCLAFVKQEHANDSSTGLSAA